MKMDHLIKDFLQMVGMGEIEIYNEFSLQHELGFFLRNNFGKLGKSKLKVQFERNVLDYFEQRQPNFEKREIDISITSTDQSEHLCAIELKYPRNGQVPETMFSFCKDIAFLEQLVSSGFKSAYFLAVVDSPLFYSDSRDSRSCGKIYGFFRGQSPHPITGTIHKPTGTQGEKDKVKVRVQGSYQAEWHPILNKVEQRKSGETEECQYCLIHIGN